MMIRVPLSLILLFVGTLGCESPGSTVSDESVDGIDHGLAMDGQTGRTDGLPVPDMTLDSMHDEGFDDLGVSDAMRPDGDVDFDAMMSLDASTVDMFTPLPDAMVVDAAEDQRIEAQIEDALEGLGVAEIEWILPTDEIENQSMLVENQVDFVDALTLGIRSFLEDGSDQESPIALLEFTVGPVCVDGSDTDRVRCFMNQPGSILRLVTPDGPPAENRERVEENWIFFMTLPSLSDHLLWAIVDRQGNRPAYNYGFN